MELYTLTPENDARLTQPVEPFDAVNPSTTDIVCLQVIVERLEATRKSHRAIGLAANQAGVNLRAFVMGSEFANFVCINPEIVSHNNVTVLDSEGCLSFPNLFIKVPRYERITVKYLDQDLKEVTCELHGVFARCFQHELDHLNGITFKDRTSKLVLAMAMKKRQEKRRFR